MLHSIFKKEDFLRYFQGYQDVSTIFLTVMGENLGFFMAQSLANLHFRYVFF